MKKWETSPQRRALDCQRAFFCGKLDSSQLLNSKSTNLTVHHMVNPTLVAQMPGSPGSHTATKEIKLLEKNR